MKAGFTTSTVLHAIVLGSAVISLSTAKPLNSQFDPIPIIFEDPSEITKSVQGDRKAKPKSPPAPKQTKLPPKVPDAQNVGETQNDTKAEAPKLQKAPPVEKTEAPTPKPAPTPVKKPTPVPIPKLAPEPKPKTDIALLLKKSQEQEPDEPVEETFEKLPDRVAAPKRRPVKPKPEVAETNERKKAEELAAAKQKEAKKRKKTEATKKAVVNKAKANAGGAKASRKKAGLGTKKANNNSKLAQSEIDALRGRLEGCWSVGDLTGHPDAEKMRARVTFKLTRSGDIDGRVKVKVSGTDRGTKATLAVRVRAAVTECAPYRLPAEKYDTWSDVVVNFSLADML